MNIKNCKILIVNLLLFYFLGIKSEDNNIIQLKVYLNGRQEPVEVIHKSHYIDTNPATGKGELVWWQTKQNLKEVYRPDYTPTSSWSPLYYPAEIKGNIDVPLGFINDFLNPHYKGPLQNIEFTLDDQKVLIDGKQLRDFIKNNPGQGINIILRPTDPKSLSWRFDSFEAVEPIVEDQ